MDSKGASTLMGPNGPYSKLIYLVDMDYEGQISFKFTFVHKDVLVIMEGCAGVSEQGIWIWLIDYLVGPIGLINQLWPILG